MTIQLFNSLAAMTTVLKVSIDINKFILPFFIFSNNFVLEHKYYNTKFRNSIEYHNIKCWKSKCILNYHIEDDYDNNRIFKLDFSINNDDTNKNNSFIKIDYIDINNDFYNRKYYYYSKTKKLLNNDEVKLIIISLIKFIENWAIKKNIKKIIIEIHSNLERYNEEFKDLGFIITENKCLLNHYWVVIEKQLK